MAAVLYKARVRFGIVNIVPFHPQSFVCVDGLALSVGADVLLLPQPLRKRRRPFWNGRLLICCRGRCEARRGSPLLQAQGYIKRWTPLCPFCSSRTDFAHSGFKKDTWVLCRQNQGLQGRLKMPMTCAAYGCNTKFSTESKREGISFHKFPLSNPFLLEKWRLAVRRASVTGGLWTPTRHHCLCSLHFQEHCFEIAGLIRRLREGAVPSIFHFPRSAQPKDRLGRRKRKASIGIVLATQDAVRQEHSYSVPDLETLKRRLQFSEEDRAQKDRQLRNARERESRLRQICASIKKELCEKNVLTRELQKKLALYESASENS